MRDYRDSKAMAQTMRSELAAKGISVGVGESLEIISHMFGVSDWNTLAVLIQKPKPVGIGRPSTDNTTDSAIGRNEVVLAPDLLDRYVGYYQLSPISVLTVSREGTQLSAKLSGQPSFPIYASSTTEFFYTVVDARISFIVNASGKALSATMHQNGIDMDMQRIDSATAARIANEVELAAKRKTPLPGSEAALRELVDRIGRGEPDYGRMTSALADLTRVQLPRLQPWVASRGPVTSLEFLGVGERGTDVYSVRHENGSAHWHIAIDTNAKITFAQVTAGP